MKKRERHGMTKTKEYRTWAGMITRCTNPNRNSSPYYYEKGIFVCDEWRDFSAFFADMGYAPSASHSIDRINGRWGYFKENCRWATTKEQNNNQERIKRYRFGGEMLTLKEISNLTGINYITLLCRIRDGWSHDRAFTQKPRSAGKRTFVANKKVNKNINGVVSK